MSRNIFRTHDTPAAHDPGAVTERLGAHLTRLMTDEEGMSTAE
ncbi:hypothetical protein [Gordonia terrae]|nr:hypothetical protein [Gordonia terrae]